MRPAQRLYSDGASVGLFAAVLEPLLWRLRNGKLRLREWLRRASLALFPPPRPEPLRLHVGSRSERLEGWLNLDKEAFPGVGYVADVTRGLPFAGVASLFAEHFLEHLSVDEALAFLLEAHRMLGPGGHLRLATPNIEWVLRAHDAARAEIGDCVWTARLNRAFYGWGHRFLWSRPLLGDALEACGFVDLDWPPYGESRFPEMRGLEQHERYDDTTETPHVLIVDGIKGDADPERLNDLLHTLEEELLQHTDRSYSESYWRHAWWAWRWSPRGGAVDPPSDR